MRAVQLDDPQVVDGRGRGRAVQLQALYGMDVLTNDLLDLFNAALGERVPVTMSEVGKTALVRKDFDLLRKYANFFEEHAVTTRCLRARHASHEAPGRALRFVSVAVGTPQRREQQTVVEIHFVVLFRRGWLQSAHHRLVLAAYNECPEYYGPKVRC